MAHFEDYLPIPDKVKKQIVVACKQENCQVIMAARGSLHKDDDHLYIVLVKRKNVVFRGRTYIVWYYNDSIGGLGNGMYDLTLPQALNEMANRFHVM